MWQAIGDLFDFLKWVFGFSKSPAPIKGPAGPEKPLPQPDPLPVSKTKDTRNDGAPSAPDWSYLWDNCKLDILRQVELKNFCDIIVRHKSDYLDAVSAVCHPESDKEILWRLMGALHYRESTLNFDTYLGNGQSLHHVTTIAPKGRGPFPSFKAGAIDALKMLGFDKMIVKDAYQALIFAERFNGLGYRRHGVYSPYVWAGTNMSNEMGKYIADGTYAPEAKENQLGVAAILLGLGMKQ